MRTRDLEVEGGSDVDLEAVLDAEGGRPLPAGPTKGGDDDALDQRLDEGGDDLDDDDDRTTSSRDWTNDRRRGRPRTPVRTIRTGG